LEGGEWGSSFSNGPQRKRGVANSTTIKNIPPYNFYEKSSFHKGRFLIATGLILDDNHTLCSMKRDKVSLVSYYGRELPRYKNTFNFFLDTADISSEVILSRDNIRFPYQN